MAAPKVSKVSEEDARLWLSSLQQVGEGWYKQVGLAVKANAHRALGMDRKQFVAQVGQRLIDPTEAILELHREGMNQNAIADVLSVHGDVVYRTLVAAGVVKHTRADRSLTGGRSQRSPATDSEGAERSPATDSTAEEMDERDEQIEALEEALEEAEAEAKDAQAAAKGEIERQTKALREQIAALKQEVAEWREAELERKRAERRAQEEAKSDADRRREAQEDEALADAAMAPVHAMHAAHTANYIAAIFDEATEMLREQIIEKGTATSGMVSQIAAARDRFNEEFAVAEAMATQPQE